jgi:hypothetical protein
MNSGNKPVVAFNTVRRKNVFTIAVKIGLRDTRIMKYILYEPMIAGS